MVEWTEILGGIQAALTGETESGRERMLACWEQTAPQDAAQRCVLAHYLADLEPDLDDEVRWDERALQAHAAVADADLTPIGMPSARALAPSLHLNLGEGYRRQGRADAARVQLAAGMAAVDALADDGYGQLIRGGLDRLSRQLDDAAVAPDLG